VGNNTRIYNRFKWWSVTDCACEFCLFYAGKNEVCPLETCAVEDERQEAYRRECGESGRAQTFGENTPCPV
jgi:hypothetical protein